MKMDKLEEALSAVGFGRFQGLAMVFAGLGLLSDSMEVMLLSFIGPALRSEWNLSPNEESLLSTAVFVGMLCGAFLWGFISDAHGRRIGFIGAEIVIVTTGIISAFSPNYKSLLVLRCFLGVGIGGVPVLSTWFLEFIPTSHRGSWMVALSGFWSVGTILEASLAWIVMPKLGWRWLLGLTTTPALIVLIISVFVPESPRFLCTKSRVVEAKRLLEKMAQFNRTTVPDGIFLPDPHDPSSTENNSNSKVKTFLRVVRELFSSKLRRTTLLLWYVYFAYVFSSYGIIMITSQLSSRKNKCGYESVHPTGLNYNLYLDTFITSLAEFPGLIMAGYFVDKFGRKMTMLVMTMSTLTMLLPLMWHQNGTVTIVLLFLARMFISGGFRIVIFYPKEVYPTSARATGDGIASAMGRVGGMICPLIAVGLVRRCHETAAVMVFEVVLFLTGICILLFPYETKGTRLNDTGEA